MHAHTYRLHEGIDKECRYITYALFMQYSLFITFEEFLYFVSLWSPEQGEHNVHCENSAHTQRSGLHKLSVSF